MTKGTASMGKKSGKRTVMRCRRCGNYSYHKIKRVCSSCGFGSTSKLRKYKWKKPGK
ncbi:MAG: 50S ribosomal protein L37e [Candidatus Woesearchaeota archaeon]